jgi:two-component system, sensor histidine kinase and response regulator
VTLHCQRIGCSSTLNQGSTFWFTVRLDQATDAGNQLSADRPPVAGILTNVRVLVVDDNGTNRKILHHQLNSMGLRDRLAASSQEALDILGLEHDADPFAIAILDVNNPGMNGFALIDAIRADPKFQNLKLIVLRSRACEGTGGFIEIRGAPEQSAGSRVSACPRISFAR